MSLLDAIQPRHVMLPFVVAAVVWIVTRLRRPKTKYRYPPGPKGLPVFGSMFDLPSAFPGPKLMEWAKQYGDMFTVKLGERKWVFLNSMETVRELLDRRGRWYISRPYFAVTQDITSRGNRIVLMGYNEKWRSLRKIMHQLLMASNADTYKPFQDIESRALVWQCLKDPERFYSHGARFANSVIFSVVFGRRTSMKEEKVRLLFSTSEDFLGSQASPTTTFIEQFPWVVRNLPRALQWFRPNADRIFNKTIKVYTSFFEDLEERIEQGEDPNCFARGLSEVASKHNLDQTQTYFAAGTIIEAGSDTTRNAINMMIAGAAKFPDWVAKVQSQLDEVCGDAERLPSFDDWDQLPLIVATMKESLRWRPNMLPFGVPRAVIQDDQYRDYVFEKDTIFVYNNYAIAHNEQEFSSHDVFSPERFLNEELQDMLKGHLGFGTGRRVCPGWFVGTRNMFIAFSRLLYCFEFREIPDDPIDPYSIPPLATKYAPFKVQIIPRSEKHVKLIERECAAAGKDV